MEGFGPISRTCSVCPLSSSAPALRRYSCYFILTPFLFISVTIASLNHIRTASGTIPKMSHLVFSNIRRIILSNNISSTLPSFMTQYFFSASSDSAIRNEFTSTNAYDLLGVRPESSFQEIKASFRKLAKQTHPDLAVSKNDSSHQRFIQILAAYEILSDSEKRAHYDSYLLSQRVFVRKNTRKGSKLYAYRSDRVVLGEMEVVEWLRWYRLAVNDIVAGKKVVVGSGYLDELERDFYSSINAAYYGPQIESWDLLPECFEAEERSICTPEVLHLVSGRDLFGTVCVVDKFRALSHSFDEELTSLASRGDAVAQHFENKSDCSSSNVEDDFHDHVDSLVYSTDAYKDLELHLSGRVVAVATRVPPKNKDSQDQIHIYLNYDQSVGRGSSDDYLTNDANVLRVPLGTVTGLGTNPEEGCCFVYDRIGTKTHVLMKHRTLLVKHMHWYRVGDEVSICECRCTRARLPPSRFWLFQPRCQMHDIGGWYIETYGKDKKGRTILSRRFWDVTDGNQEGEERLHPAVYLLTLAYRTLDIEEAKRKKKTIKDRFEQKIFQILSWDKKPVQ